MEEKYYLSNENKKYSDNKGYDELNIINEYDQEQLATSNSNLNRNENLKFFSFEEPIVDLIDEKITFLSKLY